MAANKRRDSAVAPETFQNLPPARAAKYEERGDLDVDIDLHLNLDLRS